MGGAVTIRRLIINSGDKSKGNSESARGSKALDDLPGPEVLTLLAGGHRTELSGREVVVPRVVGGLLVLHLRWGAGEECLLASPPSECGILGASTAWDGELLGTWAEEALCLVVRLDKETGRAP